MICQEVEFPDIPGLARLPMHVAVMPFARTSPDSTQNIGDAFVYSDASLGSRQGDH